MDKHLEFRLSVEIPDWMTVEEWQDYRDNLISKLRSAHWNDKSKVELKSFDVYECDGLRKVVSD